MSELPSKLHAVEPTFAPFRQPSTRIGRFDILRELGHGGFGSVYLAQDPTLKRQIAVKIPRQGLNITTALKKRFLREGEAAATLDHPNIVPVYEAGEVEGTLYIASAYCPGPTLSSWIKNQHTPISEKDAAELIAQLADAVHHAHTHGVVHRDLKPGNVLLAPIEALSNASTEGNQRLPFTPKVIDFGLAKVMDSYLTESRSSVVVGTPIYMAPEQAAGGSEASSPAVDIYALGVMLYELLTNHFPFDGDSTFSLVWAIIQTTPTSIGHYRTNVSSDLEIISRRCLEKDPRNRYRSAAELAHDLRRFQKGEPISKPRWPILRQIRYWCGRPERVFDAGILAMVLNAAIVTWMIMGFLQSAEHPELLNALPEAAGIIITMNGLMVWLGYRTLRGSVWALRVGLILSIPPFIMVAINFLGFAQLFEVFWKDKLVRTNMFFLLTLLFGIQLLAFGIAAFAHRKSKRLRSQL